MPTLDDVVGKKLGPQDFFDLRDYSDILYFNNFLARNFRDVPLDIFMQNKDTYMRIQEGRRYWIERFRNVGITRLTYGDHRLEVAFSPIEQANRAEVFSFEFTPEHRPKISLGSISPDEHHSYVSYGDALAPFWNRTELLVKTHPKMEMR